uniref:Uncharacterized protein n=1 Tax=Coturnix japonica TaxID=93934 RepID=A0A8C2U4E3_COTJA
MWLEAHWKNIRQALLLLFTAALLIGVTMLAISSNINPVGYFFLGVGGVFPILCYPTTCLCIKIKMNDHMPAIWTIASNPGSVPSPLSEPPPYNVVIESIAQGETAEVIPGVLVASNTRSASETDRDSRMHLQLVLPRNQQCFVSDINEMKGNADRFEPVEPLTPPPAYESAINDEVFDDVFHSNWKYTFCGEESEL